MQHQWHEVNDLHCNSMRRVYNLYQCEPKEKLNKKKIYVLNSIPQQLHVCWMTFQIKLNLITHKKVKKVVRLQVILKFYFHSKKNIVIIIQK